MVLMKYERVFVIVLDGCGAGTAPDAKKFGDDPNHPGNTLVNVSRACDGLQIPTLCQLGLGELLGLETKGASTPVQASRYARLMEASQGGKDTVTGHWEMMGIVVDERFPTYPDGFPNDLVEAFQAKIGRGTLGNKASSGTVIIDELGEEHLKTGSPIIYTSADSVFQIACHEEIVPIEELYKICESAREILQGEHSVQRVIARPFEGSITDGFRRTERRKDFPLSPPRNVLDILSEAGIYTSGIGVIPEVFGGRGFDYALRTQTNQEHFEATLELLKQKRSGFYFVNFEDFDMLYGHRLDPEGFGRALETFDEYLASLLSKLQTTDLLILTADHGNDPTIPSTDHSREFVPFLMTSPSWTESENLGDLDTMACVGQTVLDAFCIANSGLPGQSLLPR